MSRRAPNGLIALWLTRFAIALVIGFAIQVVPPVQNALTNIVVISLAIATEWIVSSAGGSIIRDGNILSHGVGGATVHVTEACDGVGLFILFAAAVLASRLRAVPTLRSLLLGFLMIQAFNLLRVVALFFLRSGPPVLFDLVHVYILPIVSAIILLALFLAVLDSARRPVRV
jgi:exosortase/archaeosortase family protein